MAIPATQTAIQIDAFGPPDSVKIATDVPVPTPGPGEVLVKVLLRPINPADVFSLLGVYPGYAPSSFPATLGMEAMGVVAALGPGVEPGAGHGLSVGTRVTAAIWPGFQSGYGLWQEYVRVPADALVPVPDSVSDDAAACAVINPVTVLGMLREVGPVPKGGKIALTAAGSALGRMIITICKDRGIGTIGIVRRAAQRQELLDLGATDIIVSSEEDVEARIKEVTAGEGAYAALDCLAGDSVAQLLRSVREGGLVIVYGAMNGLEFKLTVVETLFRGTSVKGYWLAHDLKALSTQGRRDVLGQVFDLYSRGIITSGITTKLPLSEVKEALKQHADVGRPGKIALVSN